MSNLLKSKFFVGGLIAVAVFAFAGIKSVSAYTHTITLKMGMKNMQVMELQKALNSNGFIIASVGAGSPGMETDYFGQLTKNAVMNFQTAHGLSMVDGVVGNQTGTAIAALTGGSVVHPAGCATSSGFSTTTGQSCSSSVYPAGCSSTSGFSTTTGMSCSGTGSTTLPAGCSSTSGFSSTTGKSCGSTSTPTTLSGGETDISNVSVDDADDTNINESASKAPVADISFDVDDADAQLVRVDVAFQLKNGENGEDRPWRAFDKVYLMDGSTVVATMDASDEDNWDDTADLTGGETDVDAQSIRFNDVNKIYTEGSNNNDLWVAVDVASSVDGADNGNDWLVAVDDEGLRFTDGAGVDTFIDAGTDTASFTVEEAGAQSDVTITQDTSSPDAGNLEVDETSSTTSTIAVFKVKADEDGGDVKIDDFPITITTTGSNTADIIDDVMIVVDGHTYNTDDNGEADGSTTYHFSDIEDDDITIDAGDTMLVTVKVKFNSQNSGPFENSNTILATSAASENDFEDADSGDDISDVSGTPAGETQTLYSTGLSVSNFDSSFDTTSDGGLVSKQTYMISFDVTAFGDTFYIPKIVERGIDGTDIADNDTTGLEYVVEASDGSIVTPASSDVGSSQSALTSSDADTVGSYFEVPEGETVTLKATIELNDTGDTAGFYHVQLTELLYDLDTTAVGTNEAIYTFAPAQDYETDDAKVD